MAARPEDEKLLVSGSPEDGPSTSADAPPQSSSSPDAQRKKDICKVVCAIVVILLLLVLVPFLVRTLSFVTILGAVGDGQCSLIDSSFIHQGFSVFNETILIVPGNKDQFGGPEFGGALFFVNTAGGKPTLTEMEIVDFPPDTNFNPQSGFFLPEKSLYFVTSHAFGKGGEQVVEFKITPQLKARYVGAWTSPLFPFGGLNSPAALDENNLFLTLSFDFGDNGSTQEDVIIPIALRFLLTGKTKRLLLFCSREPKTGAVDCMDAPGVEEGFSYANGIEFATDQKRVLIVNDLYKRKLRTFRITRPSGQHNVSLAETGGLTPPGPVKSIVRKGGSLFLGLVPFLNDGAAILAPDPANPDQGTFNVPVNQGLIASLTQDDKLFGISGAIKVGSNVLLGSAFRDGILVCKVP